MKKSCKMIITLLVVMLLALLLSAGKVEAASATITNNKTVTQGESVTITGTVTAGAWNVTLEGAGQSKKLVGQTSIVGNETQSVSITFTASNVGTYTFKLTGDITDFNDTESSVSKTCTITVKEKEATPPPTTTTPTTSKPTTSKPATTTPTEPNFKSANKTVYATGDINLRSTWSTSGSATKVAKGTELTLTGTSTEKVNGYVWYRVKYNGQTKYVSKTLVTETKPDMTETAPTEEEKSNNKNLKSLTVTPWELSPEFNPDVTSYKMTVEKDVTEVKVEALAEDENAKVEVTGNTELKDGENKITIKVTAQDETVRNYTIVVTKGEKIGLVLTKLEVNIGKLSPSFQKDIFKYDLILEEAVSSVEFDMLANDENALVEIIGNEDLSNGSIIKVLVYVGDKDSVDVVKTEYQITVKSPEEEMVKGETVANVLSKKHLIYVGTIILVTAIIIALLVARYFTTKKDKEENDFGGSMNNDFFESKSEMEKEETRRPDDFPNNEDDDNNGGRPRGKHSL